MDYKEMAEIVKRRGDRIIEEKRARAARIRRITSAVVGVCAASAAAFVVWNGGALRKASPDDFKNPESIVASEDCTEAAKATASEEETAPNEPTTSAQEEPGSPATTAAAVTSPAVTQIKEAVSTAPPKNDNDLRVTEASKASQNVVTSAAREAAAPIRTTAAQSRIEYPAVTTLPAGEDSHTRERSYYMNLISKKFAAILTTATFIPAPATAIAASDIRSNPLNSYNYSSIAGWDPAERFAEFRNDESVIDINGDGTFNVLDVHAFWSKTHRDSSYAKKDIDVDLNGYVDEYDSEKLMNYFAFYNEIRPEYFDYDYYIKDGGSESDRLVFRKFAWEFGANCNTLHAFKDIFADKVAKKEIDLDVNADGKFDLGDVYDLYAFQRAVREALSDIYMYESTYEEEYAAIEAYISQNGENETFERCLNLSKNFEFFDGFFVDAADYALLDFFDNNEFLPEYTDCNYYYSLRDYDGLALDDMMPKVYDYCEGIGLARCDMRENVDTSNIDEEYAKYLDKLAAGTASLPDANLDGTITFADYYIIDSIYGNRYKESSLCSEETRNWFFNDFDLNGNGISGDCMDCMIGQTYIMEKLGLTTQKNRDYEDFKYAWYDENVVNFPWTNTTNCFKDSLYPAYSPSDLFTLCDNYIFAFEYPDKEERENQIKRYCALIDAGELPLPDVDMNGVIDENDYYAADITRYSQTHTDLGIDLIPVEVMKNYVANFDYDGNGVSGDTMDSLVVEYYVAEKIGADPLDLENKIWEILGYVEPESEFETPTPTTGPFPNGFYSAAPTTPAEPDQPRSGDASGEGDLQMNDAVLILQSISNPDKYSLTDEGKYNADVYNTGDGVTPMDALTVQRMLLGLE